jgi:hypothetical protein
MDLPAAGRKSMDWIYLAKDRGRWLALVNGVVNLRVPKNAGNFLTSRGRTLPLLGLCQQVSMGM